MLVILTLYVAHDLLILLKYTFTRYLGCNNNHSKYLLFISFNHKEIVSLLKQHHILCHVAGFTAEFFLLSGQCLRTHILST